jgi:Fuc2NAc and GlcNAc transferase
MPDSLSWFLVAVCTASAVLTGIYRWLAVRMGMFDVPNRRSSHSIPTPRGGGVAIVLVVLVGILIQGEIGLSMPTELALVLWVFGGSIAIIGFLDDLGHVRASLRLLAHLAAVVAGLWLLSRSISDIGVATAWIPQSLSWGVLALAAAWFLNLFNFMDGIDGIAASQAVFMSCAAALLVALQGGPSYLVATWLLLGAACVGFLVWNWAPAAIFMGDAGSGFLGYVIALLLVYSVGIGAISLWTASILGAAFVADASITLLRRLLRGERWYTAHRLHAYQWLARRWRSHARVTGLFAAVNLFLVLPVAWISMRSPESAAVVSLGLYGLLSITFAIAGAGRPELVNGAGHSENPDLNPSEDVS